LFAQLCEAKLTDASRFPGGYGGFAPHQAFSKAAFQFVKKYRHGDAQEWVSDVVKNRSAALTRVYGVAPRTAACEVADASKFMYVFNKKAAPGDQK
jgi:hypothetical protein